MNKRKNKLNFIYKVTREGRLVDRYETHSKRSFYNKIRTIKWEGGYQSVYLRVSYGKSMNNLGRLEAFYNDGDYENQKDLMFALDAFAEEGLY